MTVTSGTEGTGAALSPEGRADLNKPQGLKWDPHVSDADYPHLGFNPTPGDADAVRALYKKLANCAHVLEETHGTVTKLMDGSYWQGDAAVAFREELQDGPLPLNLKNAAHSIRKAARQLDRWEGELDDFQRRAKRLEQDAKDAQAAVDAAQGRVGSARNDPALDKKNGADHDAAQKALTHANTAVDNAQADLDAIIRRAKKLAEEHEEQARYRAGKIQDATWRLAPHEPGFFESALDWVIDNMPDILSWTAAVLGVIALFVLTGGTAAAVLLLASAALSAGAFAARLADPAVRASLWDGVAKGELDSDFWSNAIGVTADGLGMLPGVSAVLKGAPALFRGVSAAGEALTPLERIAASGGKTMTAARDFSELENPFTAWVVQKAPRLETAVHAVEETAPWAGLATASYGLAANLSDRLDSDSVSNAGTAFDGFFLGPVDVAETADLVRRVFQ